MIRAIGRAVDRIPPRVAALIDRVAIAIVMFVLFWVIFGVAMLALFGPFALVGQ